jgi:hypothetical protein
MPGDEAIEHIRTVEKYPTAEDAIEQLRDAIVHRAVGAVLADMKKPPIGSTPISVPLDSIPPPEMWKTAQIKLDGTVIFSAGDSPRRFKVIRENVLGIWSEQEVDNPNAKSGQTLNTGARQRPAPVLTGVRNAIKELWPQGIPSTLKAKERNQKIADEIKLKGGSVPSGDGLARAVQRAIKSKQIP